jgi:phage shock protein A
MTMDTAAKIERELAAAEAAWKEANEGKARVCARRAVALATEAWLARLPVPTWRGDTMEHLRRLQQKASFPLPVREAAERLSTAVTRRDSAPFTTDPISDARVIIAYLTVNPEENG